MTKEELKNLKTATEKLTKWESSGKAFGHYKILKDEATEEHLDAKKKIDHLYEFWCLMRIIDDLRVNYNIRLVSKTRRDKKIFPQNPGNKNGWAYFTIEHKKDVNNKFQVCYGTNIKLSLAPKTTFAPDISIQKHDSTDDPDESMVELIMDAKFKYKNTSALPIDQLHGFMQRVNALQTQNAHTTTLEFSLFKDILANCLLTNGKALVDQEKYCKLNKIKQVERFDIGTTYNTVG
ncbi:nuclease domain-containing protein [Cognataquiflexum rubidum]|uniref:nuclease domain-containing protein n=1 Tax=Cognataquiflexum rubidum TaxID=2922273 RepID=UPI001F1419BD|nr:nuclease domain-containing protein [Cognataquiflexum rubidum]MCH6236787.1 hypothetical protein [Cognataquiflexum rubidum]